ncbi:MAG: NAD-dependent epimerase/dehydratase family protein [Elusimicrobiota bacterium]
MRVLVTGGSGFIGANVVDQLKKAGFAVRIYDMVYPSGIEGVEFYHGSLLDAMALRFAMTGCQYVMHLAAMADVNDVVADPLYAEEINVRGTINILDAARRAKVKRVVYASTIWTYSDVKDAFVTEETLIPPPAHLYTATKLAGEHYCRAFNGLYQLPYTILRYGIPYGPRARGATVISKFVSMALAGQSITIAGDGLQFRKFVHVGDLAHGNILALKPAGANQIYNLEGTEKVSIKQLAEWVKEHANPKIEVIHTPAREGDFKGAEISNKKALEQLGWKPEIEFLTGLKQVIEEKKKEIQNERTLDLVAA